MRIETATLKDLSMLRKMEEVAKAQIVRELAASNLPDSDIQLELLKVQLRISELEAELDGRKFLSDLCLFPSICE